MDYDPYEIPNYPDMIVLPMRFVPDAPADFPSSGASIRPMEAAANQPADHAFSEPAAPPAAGEARIIMTGGRGNPHWRYTA